MIALGTVVVAPTTNRHWKQTIILDQTTDRRRIGPGSAMRDGFSRSTVTQYKATKRFFIAGTRFDLPAWTGSRAYPRRKITASPTLASALPGPLSGAVFL